VQSLHKGHGRHYVPSSQSTIITILRTTVCPVVDSYERGEHQPRTPCLRRSGRPIGQQSRRWPRLLKTSAPRRTPAWRELFCLGLQADSSAGERSSQLTGWCSGRVVFWRSFRNHRQTRVPLELITEGRKPCNSFICNYLWQFSCSTPKIVDRLF
jgi:hypothetical protein